MALCYFLSFTEVGQRFEIVDEQIENEKSDRGHNEPYFLCHFHEFLSVDRHRAVAAIPSVSFPNSQNL